MAAPQITDRAKRYRAVKTVTGPKVCALCGAKASGGRPLDVMHLDGNESHGEKENLAYGCRSCNGKLAAAFKSIGAGVPTRQYNPAKGAIPTFEQYAWAVSQGGPQGRNHSGAHDEAGAIIHATPKYKRIEYAKQISRKAVGTKRERADERWNPSNPSTPAEWKKQMYRDGLEAGRKDRAAVWPVYDGSDGVDRQVEFLADSISRYDIPITKAREIAREFRRGYYQRKNPASASAEAFEEFHGHPSLEVVEFEKKVHTHEHLAAAGKLERLVVLGIDGEQHEIGGFKGAVLAFNEAKTQLFLVGGDQSINLEDFGITQPHESEVLGKVKVIDYHTDKSHLGDEGGKAVYTHQFRTTNKNGKHVTVSMAKYPTLVYDVVNEQLLLSGGSYTIRAEGIDE